MKYFISIGAVFALVFIILYYLDYKREKKLFSDPPGPGVSSIYVEMINSQEHESSMVITKMISMAGFMSEQPNVAYNISSNITKIRINRKIQDLSSQNFDDLEKWLRGQNFSGKLKIYYYIENNIYRIVSIP